MLDVIQTFLCPNKSCQLIMFVARRRWCALQLVQVKALSRVNSGLIRFNGPPIILLVEKFTWLDLEEEWWYFSRVKLVISLKSSSFFVCWKFDKALTSPTVTSGMLSIPKWQCLKLSVMTLMLFSNHHQELDRSEIICSWTKRTLLPRRNMKIITRLELGAGRIRTCNISCNTSGNISSQFVHTINDSCDHRWI